jgi:hypothetical protein
LHVNFNAKFGKNLFWKIQVKYFFFYLLLGAHYLCAQQTQTPKCRLGVNNHVRFSKTLTEPQLSEIEITKIQSQFRQIANEINADLLKYAKPASIQSHLDSWDNLKTDAYTMPTDDVKRILVTAQKALELAREVACKQSTNLQSSTRVQFAHVTSDTSAILHYIDAQLNYNKICDYLGIVP